MWDQSNHFDLKVERTAALTYVELLGELDLSCEDQFEKAVDGGSVKGFPR